MYKIKVEEEYLLKGDSVECLTNDIFQNLSTLYTNVEWLCNRTILCPTNEAVEEVNMKVLHKFPGNEIVYKSCDKILDAENSHQYPVEFLNSISASGMPPHRLCLKKGWEQVIYTKNTSGTFR